MPAQYLTQIPEALGPLIEAGKAIVRGVIVQDATTGRILGQLQQTGPLVRQLSEAASTGDPFLAVTKLVSSVVGNVQQEVLRRQNKEIIGQLGGVLSQLESLSTQMRGLQVLTGIGAAASVLNIGVSAVGFSLVLRKLDAIGDRIDAIGERIDAVGNKVFAVHDRQYKVDIITALRRSEEAFQATPARQAEMWADCEQTLDTAFTHFLLQVSGSSLATPEAAGIKTVQKLFFDDRFSFNEAVDLLDWLSTTARARHEALLLAGQPGVAAQFSRSLAGWLSGIEFDADKLAAHRLPKGQIVSTLLRKRVEAECRFASLWIKSMRQVADAQAEGAGALQEHGIDSRQVVVEAREHPEATLLYIPFEDLPEAGKSVGRPRVAA